MTTWTLPSAPDTAPVPEVSDTKRLLIDTWVAMDEARDRSKQKELGASQLGGCRRRAFYDLTDTAPVHHNIDRLGAYIGTAMHDHIEKAFNLLGDKGHFNELTVPGIPGLVGNGHIDFYWPERKTIVDWKGVKKKNLRFFPGQKYRWQASVYGYLAMQAGYEVEWIEIVAIPRDGTFDDIKVHREPYDPNVALEAIAWRSDLQVFVDNGEVPAPEPSPLCDWCPFLGAPLCDGKKAK